MIGDLVLRYIAVAMLLLSVCHSERTFEVDYEGDTFLMDGNPFQFISGSFHYFRALPQSWRLILRSMRAAGLNTVMTYIEWSLHEPSPGQYRWDGIADLEAFVRMAQEEDLYVILRPGPYICAERDMGGLPFWLLTKKPTMKLRTYDQDYITEVRKWYNELMPRMQPFLYGNGGPVIMVAIENEYGSFHACDRNYMMFLKNLTEHYTNNKAVLFTDDGPELLKCGSIPGVLATVNFGITNEPNRYWNKLREHQPKGPLVNAEFYPGWLTHWMEPLAKVDKSGVVKTLNLMLEQKVNVNFYMFFGGTNYGFTSGANDGGPGKYNTDITSYDYDAPLDEAGDPTPKYFAIRDAILKYFEDSGVPPPQKLTKMKISRVPLEKVGSLLSPHGRRLTGNLAGLSSKTVTFEELGQNSGLVLYETDLPGNLRRDPFTLTVDGLRDRAYVHINNTLCGILSRENNVYSIPLNLDHGTRLQLLVENQGRINYRIPNDFKGILGSVTVDGNELLGWTITKYPLEDYNALIQLIGQHRRRKDTEHAAAAGAQVYHMAFLLDVPEIYDTYLDPTGWGRGIVFINGFNIGRYWPQAGPQVTLYVPRHLLKQGSNTIVMIEYQKTIHNPSVVFTDEPIFT